VVEVGTVAELGFEEVEHGGFADGASDGDDVGMPAAEGDVGEKAEIAGYREVEAFFDLGDDAHAIIIHNCWSSCHGGMVQRVGFVNCVWWWYNWGIGA